MAESPEPFDCLIETEPMDIEITLPLRERVVLLEWHEVEESNPNDPPTF